MSLEPSTVCAVGFPRGLCQSCRCRKPMPPGGTRESLSRRDHAAEPGNGPGRGRHQAAGAAARLRVIRGPRFVTTFSTKSFKGAGAPGPLAGRSGLDKGTLAAAHIGPERASQRQPDRRTVYGPPPLIKSAAPFARRCRFGRALAGARITGEDASGQAEGPPPGPGGISATGATAWPATSSATAHRHGPLPPRGQPRPVRWQSPPSRAPNDRICKS